MKLEDKINELISLLDSENDCILIIALKSKIRQINQEYLATYEVSDHDISIAKKGFRKTLNSWIKDDWMSNPRICKINKILENIRKCDDCKNSIEKEFEWRRGGHFMTYKTYDKKNKKCISCENWVYKLEVELEKEEEKEEEKYNKVIPLEFYKQKALITKIQKKISLIKKNENYETS